MMRFISFVSLLSVIPSTALAQTTYDLLAPLPGLSTVTLTSYLEGMVRVTIGIAGILAVIMIVICAIQMIGSPSVSQKSASKECITNALFGLLLAISSWVILNTINERLLVSELALPALPALPPAPPASTLDDPMPTFPGWYFRWNDGTRVRVSPRFSSSSECRAVLASDVSKSSAVVLTNGVGCFQIFAPPPGTPPPAPGSPPIAPPASEAAARNLVCGNTSCSGTSPVAINKGPCTQPFQRNCTNVAGLPPATISFIQSLAPGFGGRVIITGGTEDGHASHGPSIPVFDLSITPQSKTFINANGGPLNKSFCKYANGQNSAPTSCYSKRLYNGYWFTDEGDHWHVCQNGTAAPAGKSVPLFRNACTQI